MKIGIRRIELNLKPASMKKTLSHAEILSQHLQFRGKIVLDVGCGTGDMVRWMTDLGAKVTGIDVPEMIAKASVMHRAGEEQYKVGLAQDLSFEYNSADIILYMASFHHIPAHKMLQALEKCYRILKPDGVAVFIEPVALPGSYYEIIRLAEEEAEFQNKAYMSIKASEILGFKMKVEETYYLERSFSDYHQLIDVFVEDTTRKAEIITHAEKITQTLCQQQERNFDSFRYRSVCRLNILVKKAIRN